MATKKPKAKPRARSGPSVPEADRAAKLVSLRLRPETRELLDRLAEKHGSRTAVLEAGMALLVAQQD